MGAFDTVKAVLSRLGSVEFTKVAMHPGMPQGHGVVGDERIPIITLPGNPVSSYISFEAFVRPTLRRMMGMADVLRPEVHAECIDALDSSPGKRQFARARFVAEGQVQPTGTGQGSHVLGGLAQADALIVVPEDVTRIEAGDRVTVLDLR
jgi:molybdopterin molybdotransferase